MADETSRGMFDPAGWKAGLSVRLPVTPPAGYPLSATFLRKLEKLSQDIEQSFLCALRKIVAPGRAGRMASLEVLEVETKDLAAALKTYVQADISQEAGRLFRALPTPLTPKSSVQIGKGRLVMESEEASKFYAQTLREVHAIFVELAREEIYTLLEKDSLVSQLGGELYRPFARLVAAVERNLAPEIILAFESERLIEEARDQFIIWSRLVRYCLAAVILGSLDYKKAWGTAKVYCKKGEDVKWTGIYGTGGYRLSEHISTIATDIQTLPAYDQLKRDLETYPRLSVFVSFSDSIAGPTQFPLGKWLTRSAFEPKIWRECRPCHSRVDPSAGLRKRAAGDETCGPNDQGQLFPFEFQRIARDLVNPWVDPKSLRPDVPDNADHMFARSLAQARLRIVKNHWEVFRTQLKPDLSVDSASERDPKFRDLELRLTAGSLQYGGAHPPHSSHRRGAEFDIVVRGLLSLECKSKGRVEVAEMLLGEGVLFTLDDEGEILVSFCNKWVYPSRRITWNNNGSVKDIPVSAVALKLTQCMLLTFPSQILLASWDTLRDAYNNLASRLKDVGAKQESEEDKKAVAHLLEYLRPPAPKDRPEKPCRMLTPEDNHYDHWHLTYLPSELENPPDGREQALRWIDVHITEILAD